MNSDSRSMNVWNTASCGFLYLPLDRRFSSQGWIVKLIFGGEAVDMKSDNGIRAASPFVLCSSTSACISAAEIFDSVSSKLRSAKEKETVSGALLIIVETDVFHNKEYEEPSFSLLLLMLFSPHSNVIPRVPLPVFLRFLASSSCQLKLVPNAVPPFGRLTRFKSSSNQANLLKFALSNRL
ncbi:hypothetical protein D3C77_508440 [compost metagenome]